VAQRNLQVLVEYVIEKETLAAKESIAPLKNLVTTKRKKPVCAKGGSSFSKKKLCVRLMK
jgi:hypothetical protein